MPRPASSGSGDRGLAWVALGVGLGALGAYALTLQRSLPGGDAGELAGAACAGGVAHPPGYPLYTILARVAAALPGGEPFTRINLISALCDAGAGAALAWAVGRSTRDRWAGLAAGGLFCFSPLVWRYAVGAEVFALNNLAAALLVAITVALLERPSLPGACAGAFTLGLGLANHHTLALVGAPLAALLLWRGRALLLRPRALAALIGCGALGLLPYVYLPLAGRDPPLETWGDPATLEGFLTHVLRREYGTFQLGLHEARPDLARALSLWAAALPREGLIVTPALALVGVVRGGPLGRALAAATALYLVVFFSLANLPLDDALFLDVQRRFWQLPNLLAFALAGLGLGWLAGRVRRARAAAVVAAALSVGQLALHARAADQRDNRLVERFGRALLEPLPEGAVLLTRGDLFLAATRALQACAGARPDVLVLDRELLKAPWFHRLLARRRPDVRLPATHQLAPLLEALAGRPLYASTVKADEGGAWKARFELVPSGLVHRVVARGGAPDAGAMIAESLPVLERFDPRELGALADGTWEAAVADSYFASRARLGGHALARALASGNDPAWLERSRALLEPIERWSRKPPPEVLKDLGVIYYYLRAREPALDARMRDVWERFLATAPRENPEIVQIRRILSGR